MNESSRAAFLVSQSVCALIQMEGMKAENRQREFLGLGIAYGEDAFFKLASDAGLEHNDAMRALQD